MGEEDRTFLTTHFMLGGAFVQILLQFLKNKNRYYLSTYMSYLFIQIYNNIYYKINIYIYILIHVFNINLYIIKIIIK